MSKACWSSGPAGRLISDVAARLARARRRGARIVGASPASCSASEEFTSSICRTRACKKEGFRQYLHVCVYVKNYVWSCHMYLFETLYTIQCILDYTSK